MEDAKNLTTVLSIMDNLWDKLSAELTKDQLVYLRSQLEGLESKLESAKGDDELNSIAKNFFTTFTKIKTLEFLGSPDKIQMRSGSLPEIDDEIKIKLINYCVILQDRIKNNKNGLTGK